MAPETVNSNPLPITRGIAHVVQHEECPIEAEWQPKPLEFRVSFRTQKVALSERVLELAG